MLIEDTEDYYVALDQKTHTFYVAYRDLCLIDLDLHKLDQGLHLNTAAVSQDQVTTFDVYQWCCDHFPHNQSAIEIYRSLHGYHLFLVDRPRPHDSLEQVSYMKSHGCDYYYAVFSYLRGYCVRLNKKQYKEELDPIYQYCGFWGKQKNINQRLHCLTKYHFQLTERFRNAKPCLMR